MPKTEFEIDEATGYPKFFPEERIYDPMRVPHKGYSFNTCFDIAVGEHQRGDHEKEARELLISKIISAEEEEGGYYDLIWPEILAEVRSYQARISRELGSFFGQQEIQMLIGFLKKNDTTINDEKRHLIKKYLINRYSNKVSWIGPHTLEENKNTSLVSAIAKLKKAKIVIISQNKKDSEGINQTADYSENGKPKVMFVGFQNNNHFVQLNLKEGVTENEALGQLGLESVEQVAKSQRVDVTKGTKVSILPPGFKLEELEKLQSRLLRLDTNIPKKPEERSIIPRRPLPPTKKKLDKPEMPAMPDFLKSGKEQENLEEQIIKIPQDDIEAFRDELLKATASSPKEIKLGEEGTEVTIKIKSVEDKKSENIGVYKVENDKENLLFVAEKNGDCVIEDNATYEATKTILVNLKELENKQPGVNRTIPISNFHTEERAIAFLKAYAETFSCEDGLLNIRAIKANISCDFADDGTREMLQKVLHDKNINISGKGSIIDGEDMHKKLLKMHFAKELPEPNPSTKSKRKSKFSLRRN